MILSEKNIQEYAKGWLHAGQDVNIEVNIENQVHGNVPVQNTGQIHSIKMSFCMYVVYKCQF